MPISRVHALLSSHRWLLGWVLLGHALLALVYSVMIPPWEAHDEWAHFRYAAFIAETGQLPDPGHRLTTEFQFDEASQPPLYYLLAAGPMLLTNTRDGYILEVNPFVSGENAQTGLNMVLHDPGQEAFPWRGTILALHLGRLVSIVISVLALGVTYRLIRYLVPEHPGLALWGTAFQAFAPQFVFLSGVMTNDILLALFSPLLLLLSLRLIDEGPKPRLTLAAGLVAGLAFLTKYLALAVIPLALVAFLWGAWRHREDRKPKEAWIGSTLIFLGLLGITAGALLWRNWRYTGLWIPRDPVSQQSLIVGLEQGNWQIAWDLLPLAVVNGFKTFWASFGWGNVAPDDWTYGVWLIISLVGVLGTLTWLIRGRDARRWRLVFFSGLYLLAVVSFPLLRELFHDSPFLRGRYMVAALPLAAWIVVQGWAFLSGRFWVWMRWPLLAWPLGLALILPFTLLRPAYAPPRAVTAPAPAEAVPLDARFDDAAILEDVTLWPGDDVRVGQGLAVTLTWHVLRRTAMPYALDIQLVGVGDQIYGQVMSYPGHGAAATHLWTPGLRFRETYWLVVQPELPLPTSARVLIHLYHPQASPPYLPVYDTQGTLIGDGIDVGSLRVSPETSASPPPQTSTFLARFDDMLLLEDIHVEEGVHHPGEAFPIWLSWQALGPGPQDLTLSLQLLDAQGQWVAGVDGPVSEVLLPPHWRPYDRLDTTQWFLLPSDLAPGRYQLMAVLYRSGDMTRLPVQSPQGQPFPQDMVPLAEVQIQTKF